MKITWSSYLLGVISLINPFHVTGLSLRTSNIWKPSNFRSIDLTDPLKVPISERTNKIYDWPLINLGHIFNYILKTKIFREIIFDATKTRKLIPTLIVDLLMKSLQHIPDVAINIFYLELSWQQLLRYSHANYITTNIWSLQHKYRTLKFPHSSLF